MEMGVCGLCKRSTKLCESHSIPDLIYRWLKATGGDHFRSVINPNKRQQGGSTKPFLCLECEHLFSVRETRFEQGLWQQITRSNSVGYLYTKDDIYCLLSIVWRCTLMGGFEEPIPQEWINFVISWEPYLLEKASMPDVRINVFVGCAVEEYPTRYKKNAILYLERGVDATPVCREKDKKCLGFFLKLGPLFVWITYDMGLESNGFSNTLLELKGGMLKPPQTLGELTGDFIMSRVDLHNTPRKPLSDRQRDVITQHCVERKQEILNSELGATLAREFAARKNEEEQNTTIRRGESKICRNELCPCGSRKKYKKCCLIKE